MPMSSTDSPVSPHHPHHPLRRAAGLLSSRGQPTFILPAQEHGGSGSGGGGGGGGGASEALASIRRSLLSWAAVKRVPRSLGSLARPRTASVPRAISLSSPVTHELGHKRAQSESLHTRPHLMNIPAAAASSQSVADPILLDEDEHSHPNIPSADSVPLPAGQTPPPASAAPPHSDPDEVKVPALLLQGTPLLKVSPKKRQTRIFRLDPDQGQLLWQSKKTRVIAIESIKEIRAGADARSYREQLRIAPDAEERWISIIYMVDGKYKTLHVVAAATDAFHMWLTTLRRLYALCQELMSGVGNLERRQRAWERLYWKSADERGDERLALPEVIRLCRRLNVHAPEDDIAQRFKQADVYDRGWLDFKDFQRFVKLLKARPELKRLYNSLRGNGPFDFAVFERFMRQYQKSSLSQPELEKLFHGFALIPPQSPPLPSVSLPDISPPPLVAPSALPAEPTVPAPAASSDPFASDGPFMTSPPTSPIGNNGAAIASGGEPTLSLEGFTSFLLSAENSAFTDQHGRVWQDMTRPLSEYYISSSHNTYLVGHQLVGASTVEGYIRALLQSCRSVEIDIYDGDNEPMIFHGKTLTTKVTLREVCAAIAKYAFVSSPYPVIISAEVHCSVAQQDQVSEIMRAAFGPALVDAALAGHAVPARDALPSPEALRGRVLLKAKNRYVDEHQAGVVDRPLAYDTESSSTETSTEASEAEAALAAAVKGEARELKMELEQGLSRARSMLNRVRRHASSSPSPSKRTASSDPAVPPAPTKVKMSMSLAALLVYTVGVKCRGFNKKETYALEHVFSLSERTANRIIRQDGGGGGSGSGSGSGGGSGSGMILDLVKHNRAHVVRVYPKGLRLNSSNYEPHRYWAAGAQLVAINWQTFDMGYMINHAMFQRNGRAGYVLKPLALRTQDKTALSRRTAHVLDVTIISAQQLPRAKDKEGREIVHNKHIVDPYVEVSIHVPGWPHVHVHAHHQAHHSTSLPTPSPSPPTTTTTMSTEPKTFSARTGVVKNNGFNPVWEETLALPFECVGVGDMLDVAFVKFEVKDEDKGGGGVGGGASLAVYCSSLGSLQEGYRHLPLHDHQLSQYLFSTLFVQIELRTLHSTPPPPPPQTTTTTTTAVAMTPTALTA